MAIVTSRLLPFLAAAALLLSACGSGEGEGPPAPDEETEHSQGLEHVHGLGINPADDALYIATHSGVFRLSEGSDAIERVGEGLQDTMGFTIISPDHFLASGHPGPGERGPAHLGLIESTDGGVTWEEVSLGGEVDFHALTSALGRIYGYDVAGGRLMLSSDGGSTWEERGVPAPVIDLAVDPTDAERIIISTETGLLRSESDGRQWSPVGAGGPIGLLSWPTEQRLYLVDADGAVQVSPDAGGQWERLGEIGGPPAALVAESQRELYAALPDGTVVSSTDGGASWDTRASPRDSS